MFRFGEHFFPCLVWALGNMKIAHKMIRLVAATSIFGLVVRASSISEAKPEPSLRAADLQRHLLEGGGRYILYDEQSFADKLKQSSRRTQFTIECPLKLGDIDYFDIAVQLTPQLGQQGLCPLAEQNMLGNDINAILLEYGVGDAGVDTGAIFLAGVCTVPTITNRRRLSSLATGFLWTGVGGCRKGTCKADNSDQRMLAGTRSGDGDRYLAGTWFSNTFKPQLEVTLEKAFATELVAKYTGCLGSNPGIAVSVNGITRTQLLAVECASSDVGLLETMTFANLAIRSRASVCSKCIKIDFSTKGNGTALVRGEYVKDQWLKNGLSISAKGGYSPNGNEARIFDTARLGVNGNPDLGSPNQKCGGPGKGSGGEPGKKGENCKPLGNVLIVQHSNKIQPTALKKDGSLIFNFTKPVLISDIGLMDIEEVTQRLIFTYDDGKSDTFTYLGYGDNSVQRVIANKRNVRRLEVVLQGAVVELNFCRKC